MRTALIVLVAAAGVVAGIVFYNRSKPTPEEAPPPKTESKTNEDKAVEPVPADEPAIDTVESPSGRINPNDRAKMLENLSKKQPDAGPK